MPPTLLYLLKANVALLLFAAAYFGLLRRLTFFTLNRFYLLVAVLFAAVYPVLPLPTLFPEAAGLPVVVEVLATTGGAGDAAAAPVAAPIDWEAGGLVLYAGGAAVLLARLLVQLLSLWRVRRTSRPALVHGHPVRTLTGAISPFSFWQTIYLNPARHPAAELAAVLRHEQVHVRQWHTLDVLLAQLLQALAWCNPAGWLLRRAVLDNLEYLADHATLQTGLDRQAYQYSLLRLSRGAAGPSLVSHFTFPTLKNRVAMMNTPLSSTGQLARYIVAGPLVLAVALGFSAAQAQGAGPVVPAGAASETRPAKQAPATAVSPSPAAVSQASASAKAPVAPAQSARPAKAPRARAIAAATTTPAPRAADVEVARQAPAAAQPSGPPPIYYVDGQLLNGNINDINPKDIASVTVVKGDRARQLFGTSEGTDVVVVTTKANESRADVTAFNTKLNSGKAPAAAAPEKSVAYLAPPALAYITKTYPGARLLGVALVPAPDGGAPRYQAEAVVGRRPVYLLFDAQGQFISDAYTSYVR